MSELPVKVRKISTANEKHLLQGEWLLKSCKMFEILLFSLDELNKEQINFMVGNQLFRNETADVYR